MRLGWRGRAVSVAVVVGFLALHGRSASLHDHRASASVVASKSPSLNGATTGKVVRVIDGDTLVLADGRRVRLAQVDAPETYQCFGSEATEALRRMTDGKSVTLRRPPTGPAVDRYGRTLADVVVVGRSVNEALVRDGDAGWYEQFADEDADLARRLAAAEQSARASHRGLWKTCAKAS